MKVGRQAGASLAKITAHPRKRKPAVQRGHDREGRRERFAESALPRGIRRICCAGLPHIAAGPMLAYFVRHCARPAACLSLCVVLAACQMTPEATGPADAAWPADVRPVLEDVDLAAFRTAFTDVGAWTFVREIETVRLDDAGAEDGRATRVVRYEPAGGLLAPTVLDTRSEGSLRTEADAPLEGRLALFDEDVLPDEPAFLSARSAEQFRYRLLPDTTWGTATVRVVEAVARPDVGADQPIQQARLFVTDAGRLVGIDLERRDDRLLYEETRTVSAALQNVGGVWLPDRFFVESRLDLPLSAPQHVRTTSRFRDFQRALDAGTTAALGR